MRGPGNFDYTQTREGYHDQEDGIDPAPAVGRARPRRSPACRSRGTVEETLNEMLEAEADRLCNAGRYERSEGRRDQRSGSYDRKLQTKAGEVS